MKQVTQSETSEQETFRIIYATTEVVCDDLSNIELASLDIFCHLGQVAPEQRAFWPKAKALFTQDVGKKIHEDSVRAIHDIADRRLRQRIGREAINA